MRATREEKNLCESFDDEIEDEDEDVPANDDVDNPEVEAVNNSGPTLHKNKRKSQRQRIVGCLTKEMESIVF